VAPALQNRPPMLRRATLLLCLLPGAALAQVTTPGSTSALVTTQGVSGLANQAECASTTSTSNWTISSSVSPVIANGDRYRLGAATQSTGCATSGTVPAGISQDVTATGSTQAVNGVFVSAIAATASVGSCTQANDVPIVLCVYYLPGGSTANWQLASQGTFVFQLAIPPKPTIGGVTPGDSQLSVSVAAGTATATETATRSVTYKVTCTPSTGGGSPSIGGPSNVGTVVCGGLTNSIPYTVTAQASSQAGNLGAVSDVTGPNASTTPLPFLNFWQVYKNQGGVEEGGCSTGGAGTLGPALALLGLLAARRRRS
jgi:MYXO-CTERM domain-containing protein